MTDFFSNFIYLLLFFLPLCDLDVSGRCGIYILICYNKKNKLILLKKVQWEQKESSRRVRTCSVSKEESWASSWNIFIAQNNGSYCGNKIVEEGEECDCGRPDECDAVDACCVARDDALRIPGCTVRQGKQCRWDTWQATFCASFICHIHLPIIPLRQMYSFSD